MMETVEGVAVERGESRASPDQRGSCIALLWRILVVTSESCYGQHAKVHSVFCSDTCIIAYRPLAMGLHSSSAIVVVASVKANGECKSFGSDDIVLSSDASASWLQITSAAYEKPLRVHIGHD